MGKDKERNKREKVRVKKKGNAPDESDRIWSWPCIGMARLTSKGKTEKPVTKGKKKMSIVVGITITSH